MTILYVTLNPVTDPMEVVAHINEGHSLDGAAELRLIPPGAPAESKVQLGDILAGHWIDVRKKEAGMRNVVYLPIDVDRNMANPKLDFTIEIEARTGSTALEFQELDFTATPPSLASIGPVKEIEAKFSSASAKTKRIDVFIEVIS